MNPSAILDLISDLYEAVSALNAENSQLKTEVASLRNALGAGNSAGESPPADGKAGGEAA